MDKAEWKDKNGGEKDKVKESYKINYEVIK